MTKPTRFCVAAAFGLAGLLSALALIFWGNTEGLRFVRANNTQLFIVSGPSAAMAGWICARLFGRPEQAGWFLAGVGALLTTVLGAAIGGTLLASAAGTIVAPIVLFWNFIVYPEVGISWVFSMALLHVIVLKIRA